MSKSVFKRTLKTEIRGDNGLPVFLDAQIRRSSYGTYSSRVLTRIGDDLLTIAAWENHPTHQQAKTSLFYRSVGALVALRKISQGAKKNRLPAALCYLPDAGQRFTSQQTV